LFSCVGGVAGGDAGFVKPDKGAACYRFRAPIGRLHAWLGINDENYVVTERAFDIVPGRKDLVFELTRRASVRLHFADGAARVPWNEEVCVFAQPLDGRGGVVGWE